MRRIALIAFLSITTDGLATPPVSLQEGEILFSLKVYPTLSSKCFSCHGKDSGKIKGELNLTSREGLLKGGESETTSLTPGKPLLSPVYLASTRNHEPDWSAMPPKDNDRLSAGQIMAIKEWIELGAPWPDQQRRERYTAKERSRTTTSEGMLMETSGGLSEEWTYRRYKPEDLWAFLPIKKTDVPPGSSNPVDAFISLKLKEAEFKPAPQANFRTLIKRAYYDLTGLPPTPYQIYQFRLEWDKILPLHGIS